MDPADDPAVIDPAIRSHILDEEHLRLLALGHTIAAGVYAAFASLFIIHLVFFTAIASHPEMFPTREASGTLPPDQLLHVFTGILAAFILAGWAFAALTYYSGRCIARRRRRALTIVVAALNTLMMPIGTVLAIATFMVLARDSVRKLYPS